MFTKGSPLALLAAVLVALAAPAAAPAADGFTGRPLQIDVVVGPDDDVTCRMEADLYVPDGASASNPVPAILTTNGFGGSKHDQRRTGESFAKRGYAVLSYSGLGFGGSDCKVTLDDRDYDGKAASQLITFLGGGKAAVDGTTIDFVKRDAKGSDGQAHDHDPRVGMVGGSYGGQVQFAAAGVDPRLDTIVPLITWNDLSYSLTPNTTSLLPGRTTWQTPGINKFVWATLFFTVGVGQGLENIATDPGRILPCPNFDDRVCAAKVVLDTTGAPNAAATAALRHASVSTYIDRIKIPTFLIQGQADTLFTLNEAIATYRALKAQGTPAKLAFQQGGHSGPQAKGELDLNLDKPTHLGTQIFEWFEHHLRDSPKVPSLDFTFFRDWVSYDGTATPAYGRAPAYPAGRREELRLSGSNGLVREGEQVRAGSATFLTTVAGLPTSITDLAAIPLGADPIDLPGTTTAFTSAPLEEPLEVVGAPTARLRVEADLHALTGSATDISGLAFFLRLEDVGPDGKAKLPYRLVAPVRVADPSVPVEVELPAIVHRFAKGHRLRLVAYGGDLAYRAGNVPGPVTIRTAPGAPSTLEVPVVEEGRDYGPVVAAAAPCTSRRVTFNVKRQYRRALRSGRIVVGGKRVATLSRKRTKARVTLRAPKKAGRRVTVRIEMRLRGNRTRTDVRRLRVCAS